MPTRFIVEQGLKAKDRLPDYAYAKMLMVAERHFEAINIAHEAGVRIALGTDIFGQDRRPASHGV